MWRGLVYGMPRLVLGCEEGGIGLDEGLDLGHGTNQALHLATVQRDREASKAVDALGQGSGGWSSDWPFRHRTAEAPNNALVAWIGQRCKSRFRDRSVVQRSTRQRLQCNKRSGQSRGVAVLCTPAMIQIPPPLVPDTTLLPKPFKGVAVTPYSMYTTHTHTNTIPIPPTGWGLSNS